MDPFLQAAIDEAKLGLAEGGIPTPQAAIATPQLLRIRSVFGFI